MAHAWHMTDDSGHPGQRSVASVYDRSVDEERLEAALQGLRRFGDDVAVRAADLLETAVDHSAARGKRWTDQLCYCLRECLVSIPRLFGAERPDTGPLADTVRRLAAEMAGVIDQPPEAQRVLAQLQAELDAAATARSFRIAQAMMIQAGMGLSSPRVDEFAREWTDAVERANNILHGDAHAESEVLALLGAAVDLLAAIVGPISGRLEEVDRCLEAEPPSDPVVLRVMQLIADDRLARYFFSKASSGAWLEALERQRVFDTPMQGDWHQAGLLIRAGAQRPEIALQISRRITGDPHRASAIVVLGVVRELGPSATPVAVQVLSPNAFQDSFAVAHELERLIEKWAGEGTTGTLHQFVDVALEPVARDGAWRVASKFEDHQFARLVELFVTKVACEDLPELSRKLMYKVRHAAAIGRSGLGLSFAMDFVDGDPTRDVASALVGGLRSALRRLGECGNDLPSRKLIVGDLDDEILVRVWAEHLAEEEEHAS